MKRLVMIALCLAVAGCQSASNEGGVMNKVLTDFGLKGHPEGYVSGTDKVYQSLAGVGEAELKRLNIAERQGEVKFQQDGLHGQYYKEVKRYENYYPLDAQPVNRTMEGQIMYNGYIAYSYRIYQSERKATRVEAAAESATIPTDTQGRETYRYNFSAGGVWDGAKGEKAKR